EENVYHEQYTSREYYRTVYADGTEWWSEALIERNNYSADFGKFGIVYGYEELHTRSDSSGWFESDSHAKVYLKGHEFKIYDERSGNGWLERYDYTYDFDGECCMATEVYTRSNDKYEDGKPEEGKSHERTYCCCRFSEYTTIEMPTCTQDGYAAVKCAICGKEDGKNTIPANRHNWIPLNEKWYYCFSCGLENTNGADGDIVLEDLTDKYGNGESYVVGYYDQNGKIEFYTLVSLVDKNGEFLSDIFPKIEEVNGLRAYAVSIAEIKTIAAELGITDYDVRFSFVPTYGDGMFDYAITFTENLTPGAITGSTNFVDYISKEETKVYTITPSKDGVWVFISITNGDTHATLFDSEGNLLELSDDDYDNDFRIEIKLLAGETYYLNVRWYTFYEGGDGANMALSFTFNANDNGDDEGKTENGDVEYPEEKVEGDEIVVVPEEKFEGKYVEVIG
ncbi:MAG: hypothetical protein J6U68_03140, partial [Clostridia bacterium]|nr:hypothetical protein [Clostridia bacterium]